MPGCAVSSCSAYSRKTRGTEITFHSFPRDPTLQNLWLKLCRRKDALNMKYATICSQHFIESDYIRDLQAELLGLPPKRRLKDDAVPSVNLPQASDDVSFSSSLNALKDDEELRRLLNSSEARWRAQAGLLCRLCANSDFKCIPIFQGKGLEQKLLTKIQNYLPIDIHKDDKLPDQVCPKCLSSINTWHSFTEDCIAADQRLKELLCCDDQVLNLPISKTRRKIVQAGTDDKSQEIKHQSCDVKIEQGLQEVSSNTYLKDETLSGNIPVGNVMYRRDSDNNTSSSTEFIDSGYMSVETIEANSDTPLGTETGENDNNLKLIKIDDNGVAEKVLYSKRYVLTENIPPKEKYKKNEMRVYTLGQIVIQNGDRIKKYVRLKTFTCDTCSVSFSSHGDLEKHKNSVHFNASCIFCSSDFVSKEALLQHESKVHGTQLQSCLFESGLLKTCPICRQEFSLYDLRKHLHCHSELCATCLKVFTDRDEYEQHRKCHYVDFLCETCGKKFETKNNLLAHKQTHIKPNFILDGENVKSAIKLQCDICGSLFKNKLMIQHHMILHGADNKKCFVCQTCGKEFHRARNLNMHVKAHSELRPYKCETCHKSFKWKKNLKEHQSVHTGRKDARKYMPIRVQCDVCGKIFASKQYLSSHMMNLHNNTHDNNTVKSCFMCHICGKVLSDSVGMNRHIRTHGGIKLFNCSICNRSFSTKMSKEDHERGHTGEKPFRCSVCGKCFSGRPHLNIHQKIHSSLRPYKCTICDKSFRRRSHLVFHIRTHTGDKRFKCDICDRAFIQKSDRNKHMLIHIKSKCYPCKCGLSFSLKADLLNHQIAYAYDEFHMDALTSQ